MTAPRSTVLEPRGEQADGVEPVLFAWSAPDEETERALRGRLAGRVSGLTGKQLVEVADELTQCSKPGHAIRGAMVVDDGSVAAALLRGPSEARTRRIDQRAPRPVALLLPGHGSQYQGMGTQLYGREPIVTRAMDSFCNAYGEGGDLLRSDWLSAEPQVPIDAAERGQPLLFALGYGISRTIGTWGIQPAAMVGHSVGELIAAAISGVLRNVDAARLMAARAPHYQESAPGGLLAVAATPETLAPFLVDGAVIGVVNGPGQTMIAGSTQALQTIQAALREKGHVCMPAKIPVPFHSPLMEPLAEAFAAAFAGIDLSPPRIPIYSTRTGRPVTDAQATDPTFWAGQVSSPVLFWPALDALLNSGDYLLVEAGPGRALTSIARRHPAVIEGRSDVVAAMPSRPGLAGADRRDLLGAGARIWLEGHPLNWTAIR